MALLSAVGDINKGVTLATKEAAFWLDRQHIHVGKDK